MCNKKQRLTWVDALRGWAILGVILVHTGQCGLGELGLPGFFSTIVHEGARGVQLFYLMSGFTMFYTYKNHILHETYYVGNFFIRRFFRIAPLYYIAIAYYLWQDGWGPRYWLGDASQISVWNIVSNILFMHGLYPYWINSLVPGGWSITVEMTFYLFVPFLILYINSKSKAMLLSISSLIIFQAVSLILRKYPLILDYQLWQNYLLLYLPNQVPIFSLGIILYFLIFPKGRENDKNDPQIFIYSLLISGLILLGYCIFGKGIPAIYKFSLSFIIIAFVCSQFKISIIENRLTIFVGKLSYSLYLIHFASLYWLNKLNLLDLIGNRTGTYAIGNFILRYIIVLLTSILISTIIYNVIEQPCIRIGRKIIAIRETSSANLIGLIKRLS